VQSELAKHTSLHSFDVGSQNWLSQSVPLPHESPSAEWPAPGRHAATMPALPVVDTTYAHDAPCPQSGVFRQALLQPASPPLQSSLSQSLSWSHVAPF
jgi:hypothetical protein